MQPTIIVQLKECLVALAVFRCLSVLHEALGSALKCNSITRNDKSIMSELKSDHTFH